MLRYSIYPANQDCESPSRPGLVGRQKPSARLVNDMHSRLNPTVIKSLLKPGNALELQAIINRARLSGDKISVAGGRHAMGGQQFLQNGLLIDTSAMNKVLNFDQEQGLLEIEAGMNWSQIVDYLQKSQAGSKAPWTIIQKQTGCNNLSIGGSLAANGHGRGLQLPPLVSNLQEFKLLDSKGRLLSCDRSKNKTLFSTAVGGYGMFGIMSSATIRLSRRQILERRVQIAQSKEAVSLLEAARDYGALYGDFQFAIDEKSKDFLQTGILSSYRPVEAGNLELLSGKKLLSDSDWLELLYLAHSNKSAAFEKYANHYLSTNGQLYLSDTFQLATYLDNYHQELDRRMPHKCSGSEMISELYVPRQKLAEFLSGAAALLREQKADLIYGTVRLIEKDHETFLAWAKEPWACIVFNLHVQHTPHGVFSAGQTFCSLIDLAQSLSGSFFLTYHRFASSRQVLNSYPQMPQFLERKKSYDPEELFASDWYEHMKTLAV